MKRKTKMFALHDVCCAAYSRSGAIKLFKSRYDDVNGKEVTEVTGSVSYCNEDGEIIGTTLGEDCSDVWPTPCILPDIC